MVPLSRRWGAQTVIQLVAGCYLLWLGIGMMRSGVGKQQRRPLVSHSSAFVRGFLTSITNPKALAFFSSAFALAAPTQPTPHYLVMAVATLTTLSAVWHCLLALIFASPVLRGYRSSKKRIDLGVGLVLISLGGAMVVTATMCGFV